MSVYVSVNFTRAATPLNASPIWIQLDLMTQQQAAAYGGASAGEAPYFRYKGFLPSLVVLAQGDLCTDTINIDPLTGTFKKYRLIGDPNPFPNGHTEIVVDRYIGK